MEVKWTDEQQQVIDLRNRNILVSAAAGSGKTAVLVERIIQMLTDNEHPVDVDRLLIVTFTEAAAAEMKERIREAIEKNLEEHPENVHLQRQSTLIHSAMITTIHSFCLSVIREHFHVLDIDPGFRIAEEGELKLLKQDVLSELLETYYTEGSRAYLEFIEKFGTGRNDKKVEEIILKLYEYSRSYPQPDVWLDSCVESYQVNLPVADDENGQDAWTDILCESACMLRVEELVCQRGADMIAILEQGLQLCDMPDGPYMYGEILESDQIEVQKILKAKGFREMYQAVIGATWKRLSTKKDDSVDSDKREQVKVLRDKMKKMVKDIAAMYFYEEPEEILRDMADSAETMGVLVRLVKGFATMFSEKKQSKNMIDFNDMEQFALRILTVESAGGLIPSPSATEYQEQFAEVMIDEYQDSNLIQEAILTSVSKVSKGQNNVFMVGDVKQSIYRFRLSRPELFMEKYDSYSVTESDKQRIDLHKNFRSRTQVLESVNFIFEHIMRRELGGIQYDNLAALHLGADFEPQNDEDGQSVHEAEILLAEAKENGREMEARAVARRIKELMQAGCVLDKATKKHRKPTYQDIVILTRSVKGWADVFSSVLAEEGIPAYAGSREGYFEAYEISVLLDYLRLLDNFRQELPLAAVLTSTFAGLKAQQMAEIRSAFPEQPFYEAVKEYAFVENGNVELQKMLQAFLDTLEHFRETVPYTPIHELLWNIIEETGYGIYVSSMPAGEQRKANLEMLVEKAAAFEGTSYKGLFNFVRYIEQLQKYDVDYGEANIADEQFNTVRIMTIHKSKGLEFPIVFVAGMGRRFSTQDVKGSIVIHPEWGVGIDAIDLEKRTKVSTILKKVIQEEITRDNLGEELRVLYVALTRAKEKLIMTSSVSDAKELLAQYAGSPVSKEEFLPYYMLMGAHSYLDWVLPLTPLLDQDVPLHVRVMDETELMDVAIIENQAEYIAKSVLLNWNTEQVYQKQLRKDLKTQLGYTYPYEKDGKLKLKFTVSELKKRAYLEAEAGEVVYEEPEVIPLLPNFLAEESELTGASRGSAYHKLLELLDFTKSYNEQLLNDEIKGFEDAGKLSAEMVACIDIKNILEFLQCPAGQRMGHAATKNLLKMEQPFVLGVDAGEIYQGEESDETILVQGIIDVYFEEDGELVVLDYKTDKVRDGKALSEKYHAQLEYYGQALEQLLGKKVKERIIYSFTLGEEIYV